MRKLIGVLSLMALLCGFAGQAKAEIIYPGLSYPVALGLYAYFPSINTHDIGLGSLQVGTGSTHSRDFYAQFQSSGSGAFEIPLDNVRAVFTYGTDPRWDYYIQTWDLSGLPAITGQYISNVETGGVDDYILNFDAFSIDYEFSYDWIIHMDHVTTVNLFLTLSLTSDGTFSVTLNNNITESASPVVPIPAAALLLGSGLGGLAVLRRKIK